MTSNLNLKQDTWSFATKQTLDTLPRPWTRGLLYFLVSFIAISLPWAMLSKVDETGMAQGRLEPKGYTVKLDSEIAGKIEKIYAREGELVKAGQPILTLDSQLIQTDLQQAKEKLEGQIDKLDRLNVLKNQLDLSLSIQQQQNQSQELEKETKIAQAKENLESLKTKANLQKMEKLAQVDRAEVALTRSKKEAPIVESRYQVALKEIDRYQKAFKEGVIAEVQVVDKEDNAKEIQRLYEQSGSEIQENKQRLTELKSLYQQTIEQIKGDIEQANLKLQEQQRNYQTLKHSNQIALFKVREQINNLETEIGMLRSEIEQNQSQIKSLQIQLTQRVIKANIDGTIFQLPIKKAGAVVQTGTPIAEIAPKGSIFILRAQMASDRSSFLKTGLAVKLKFDAYPFQDYGIVPGTLTKISPTTIEIDTPNGKANAYQLEIELNKTCIVKNNQCIELHPGDTATAEVIIRQRRVIDFVIDPFKTLAKEGLKL